MKAIIVGDLHIGIKNQTEFIDFQIKNLNRIIDYTINSDIKNIILLGDIFHTRQSIDINILHKVLECFDRLESSDLKIYILAGNHDVYFKTDNEINSLSTILKKYTFNVIDIFSKEITIDDEKCLFVPWVNKQNFAVCINDIKDTSATFCFGHFAINDFYLIRGVKEKSGFSQSIFKKFDKTFSGHFHLKGYENNICYVGGFCQLDWNDYGDEKQIIKFDSESEDICENIYLTDTIFEKVYFNGDEIHVDDFKNKILKIYIDKKLTAKKYSVLDTLKENALSCEVIDNTILYEEINENIKNENFLDLLDEVIEQQENIDDENKNAIKDYLKKLYDLTLKGE